MRNSNTIFSKRYAEGLGGWEKTRLAAITKQAEWSSKCKNSKSAGNAGLKNR